MTVSTLFAPAHSAPAHPTRAWRVGAPKPCADARPAPARSVPSAVTPAGIDAARAGAAGEILVALRGTAGRGEGGVATFGRTDLENLRRGVRYRVLVPDRARTVPALATRLGALALAGAEVRTMPNVPLEALVIDAALVVLPAAPAGSPAGVAVLGLSGVVGTVVELFDLLWPAAVPFAGDPAGPTELTGRERELLTLLSAGCTDEAVAVQLGISVRTVRRMVAAIMVRLGARSRFEAGAKAADRGWLEAKAG